MYPVSEAFQQEVQENTRKYYWTGKIPTAAGAEYVWEFTPNQGNGTVVAAADYLTGVMCAVSERTGSFPLGQAEIRHRMDLAGLCEENLIDRQFML